MEGSLSRVSKVRPGGHELRREVVVRHQRERILDAVAELVAEEGYRPVSVAKIVKRAKTTRTTFYEKFSSKEDCFLAAVDGAYEEAIRRVGEAADGAGDSFAARVTAGIGALLAYMSQQPQLARACILEAPSLGAAIGERAERARADFAALLRGGREAGGEAELPASIDEAVLGGLYWLLYQALLSGQPSQIEELRAELIEFALAAYLGPEVARSHAQPVR